MAKYKRKEYVSSEDHKYLVRASKMCFRYPKKVTYITYAASYLIRNFVYRNKRINAGVNRLVWLIDPAKLPKKSKRTFNGENYNTFMANFFKTQIT